MKNKNLMYLGVAIAAYLLFFQRKSVAGIYGKLSKEDALAIALEMWVDFNKPAAVMSISTLSELSELAKKTGFRKSSSSSMSTGTAFFYHLQKLYNKTI